MKEDHVSESAAQCAYYVILSFIPFLILLLTLIQYTALEPQQLFDIISNLIPENMREMVLGIVQEVYSKSLGTISISLLFTLFSADRGFFAFSKEMHRINCFYDQKRRSVLYLKLLSLGQTILFIILLTFGLLAMVFGKSIISTLKQNSELFQNFNISSEILTQIGFLLGAFIVFLFIYKFMATYQLSFKSQLRGAVFASVAINVISFVFSRYLNIFKGFSTTYGSLTTLILIMMWTYACFYVIFLGAEINKWSNKKKDTSIF